jgi:glycosyltransferase involved in cell wall biosynthesis
MKPATPQKILFCENNTDGTIGGSYFSLLYLVRGLDRSRYSPIVVFHSENDLLSEFRNAGAEVLVWPRPKSSAFSAPPGSGVIVNKVVRPAVTAMQKGLNFSRSFLLPAFKMAGFLRRRGIRIVHLNNSVLRNHDWMLAALIARVKCLTHERGINPVYSRTARFFGKRLDAVICISTAVSENMRLRGANFENLVTIHNGLDPDDLLERRGATDVRVAHGIFPEDYLIVMIGNIREWKGQETLIRALGGLRRAHLAVIRCLLVGATTPGDLPYEQRLRGLVAAHGLERQVIFTGYQSGVGDYLTAADVVIHASINPEPFGRVILEAMACRKPVIAARGGAIPEIVEEGRTGLMFHPGDTESLRAALVTLFEKPDRGRKWGEQGFDRLVREFPITKNVKATEALYERLLDEAS